MNVKRLIVVTYHKLCNDAKLNDKENYDILAGLATIILEIKWRTRGIYEHRMESSTGHSEFTEWSCKNS